MLTTKTLEHLMVRVVESFYFLFGSRRIFTAFAISFMECRDCNNPLFSWTSSFINQILPFDYRSYFSRMRSEGFPFIVGVWGWTCVRVVLLVSSSPRRRVVVASSSPTRRQLPSSSKTPYLRFSLFKVCFFKGFSLNKGFSFLT